MCKHELDNVKYLSVSAASEFLSLSKKYLYNLVSEKRITFYKTGKRVTFDKDDLIKFMNKGKVNQKYD